MREFSIFQNVCDGRVYSVLKWLKWADAETISPHVVSSMLRLELCHCPRDDLDMLANGIRHMLLDGEIDEIGTAPEKESLLFLLFLKAHSIHGGFEGTLQPLGVRAAVVRRRLKKYDAEAVVGSEEQYCRMSLQLCAEESLSWYEHMTITYVEPLLISEILGFLTNNGMQPRKAQYEQALQRALTKRETGILAGHAASQAAFSLNWLNDYKTYTEFVRQPPEAEIQAKIDAYVASLQNADETHS